MKRLIVAALSVLAFAASASDVLVMGNDAGGQLVLTPRPCILVNGRNAPEYRAAYTTTRRGEILQACWRPMDGMVAVVFFDGDVRVYEIQAFRAVTLK